MLYCGRCTIHQESIPFITPSKHFVSTSRTHLCIPLQSSSHSARTKVCCGNTSHSLTLEATRRWRQGNEGGVNSTELGGRPSADRIYSHSSHGSGFISKMHILLHGYQDFGVMNSYNVDSRSDSLFVLPYTVFFFFLNTRQNFRNTCLTHSIFPGIELEDY